MVYTYNRNFSCSDEQIFDLLIDSESYPLFLEWWETAEILERQENTLRHQHIAQLFGMRQRFTLITTYERPLWIRNVLEKEICKKFEYDWKIKYITSSTCDVTFNLDMVFATEPLQTRFDEMAEEFLLDILENCDKEGQKRYG